MLRMLLLLLILPAILLFTWSVSAAPPGGLGLAPTATYPLKVSANGRYLVDQNNQPFFLTGDAAWSLIVQLTNEDAAYYLTNRQQHGFNTVLVNLIEHRFASNPPNNIYGAAPFTGQTFTTPNPAYFAHADAVITAAAQRGILVLLNPLYLGWQCGDDGWCGAVSAASEADMEAWGQYVGNRYKNFDNIIWVVGGDTDPTPVKQKVNRFALALQQADGRHLITAHNYPEDTGGSNGMAIGPWNGASWLTLNNTYTYSNTLYRLSKTAYAVSPVMPYYLMESAYENEHSSSEQARRAQTYWTILSGGFGHVFGNCPIWHFGSTPNYVNCDQQTTDWKSWLDRQGSLNMQNAAGLFNTLAWQTLIPDWNHEVMTAGYGDWEKVNYATAARSGDGTLVVVYMPNVRQVTVDLSKLAGAVTARWYDPANGTFSAIAGSPFANVGTKVFTPAGNNSGGDGDWVLVLQADAATAPTPTKTSTPSKTPTDVVSPSATPPVGGSPTATPTSAQTIFMGETRILGTNDNGNGSLLSAQRVRLGQAATLQSLSFYVSATGGRLRLGIYDSTGPNGGPGARKAMTRPFTAVEGWNTIPVKSPVLLQPGRYWLAFLPESSGLGFPMEKKGASRWYTKAYGKLPTAFSSAPNRERLHWSFYATLTID